MPDHPFKKQPEYTVLRHNYNKKWYALIMKLPRNKVGLAGNELMEVVNVKVDLEMAEILSQSNDFFPAYHMNKEHWITVRLDGQLEKEIVFSLLDESFWLTK
nr:MmcQ/YjbR family DNA-binding protein [Enterococcus sp. 9E7_DIV0242]